MAKKLSIKDSFPDNGIPSTKPFPIESAGMKLTNIFDLPRDRVIAQYKVPALSDHTLLVEINFLPGEKVKLNLMGPWGAGAEEAGIEAKYLADYHKLKGLAAGLALNIRGGTITIGDKTGTYDFDHGVPGVAKANANHRKTQAAKKKAAPRRKVPAKKK